MSKYRQICSYCTKARAALYALISSPISLLYHFPIFIYTNTPSLPLRLEKDTAVAGKSADCTITGISVHVGPPATAPREAAEGRCDWTPHIYSVSVRQSDRGEVQSDGGESLSRGGKPASVVCISTFNWSLFFFNCAALKVKMNPCDHKICLMSCKVRAAEKRGSPCSSGLPIRQHGRGRRDEREEGGKEERERGRAELGFSSFSSCFFSPYRSARGTGLYMSLMCTPHYANGSPTEAAFKWWCTRSGWRRGTTPRRKK